MPRFPITREPGHYPWRGQRYALSPRGYLSGVPEQVHRGTENR